LFYVCFVDLVCISRGQDNRYLLTGGDNRYLLYIYFVVHVIDLKRLRVTHCCIAI